MKIVNEITITLNVNYSNQPSTVKRSLGFIPFFVLEREETENQKYKHASACFHFSRTTYKTTSSEWPVPNPFCTRLLSIQFRVGETCNLHLPTTTFWCCGKAPLTSGGLCFLWFSKEIVLLTKGKSYL